MGNIGTENDISSRCDEESGTGESYSLAAFAKMNNFRKHGHLCDVVIKVGGREFLAHRVVLAATSDYFDAMFSNGMAESAQLEVELKSISPDIMDALLDYVYTGQVRVTMDNVQDLLPAASLVQMEGVKTACSNFLLAEVDASNVLGIRRFAELHNCAELEKFARNYAAHNFELVAEYEEFLCLNHEELLDLVAREDLHIDCEESVYRAVMRWVYHQSSGRAQHLSALLAHIRLPVMSVRFLTDVVDKDALIRQSLECRDLVDDAKRFHLRPDLRHDMRERRYRQRDCGDEYLVVIGGFGSDQNPSDSVEMFNPRTLEWSELPDLPISYRYVAACSLDTCVYVIGGFDGRERLNTVCLLDIAQREEGWRWLTPMHYKRGLSAACTHKGLIYVCGGFDGQSRLRSLEVYHPKIDEWRILEDMTTSREGAGLVVVDDTLYCLGGYDGFHLLNSMEAFDLRRGSWSVCKPMYMRRSGAGCALLGDTIYVCGGYGGAEGRGPLHLDTVEAYNVRLQQWTLITSMNVPRCYVGACALAGKIYVAAGYNGSRLLDTVESYDPVENVWWLHDESRMNHERCDTGMCVVRFLSSGTPASAHPSCSSRVTNSSAVPANIGVPPAENLEPINNPPQLSLLGASTGSRRLPDSSGYRVPMLPLVPQLRGGLTSLFRRGPLSHRSHLSDLEQNLNRGMPIVTSTGVPLLNNVNVTPTPFRGPPRLSSRNIPIGSLHRHPDLPGRNHPPFQSHGPGRGGLVGSCSRQSRQLLGAFSPGPGCSTDRMQLPMLTSIDNFGCRETVCSGPEGTSVLTSSGFSAEHPTAYSTTGDSVLDHEAGELDGYFSRRDTNASDTGLFTETCNTETCCERTEHHMPRSLRSTSPRPLLNDLSEQVSDSRTHDPTFQASSSSSPTLLSRMYHSAPESSATQTRHPGWFHSAEALNADHSNYRIWLDRNVTLLDNEGTGSDSGSEINFPGLQHRTDELGEVQAEAEDGAIDSFSDAFNTVPTSTLFSYLRLEEIPTDAQDQDGTSDASADLEDAALSSPTTPSQLPGQVNVLECGECGSSGLHITSSSSIFPAGCQLAHESVSSTSALGAPPSVCGPCFVDSSGDSVANRFCDTGTNVHKVKCAMDRQSFSHGGPNTRGLECPSVAANNLDEPNLPFVEVMASMDSNYPAEATGDSNGNATSLTAPGLDNLNMRDRIEPVSSSDQSQRCLPVATEPQQVAQGAPDVSCSLAYDQQSVPDHVNEADAVTNRSINSVSSPTDAESSGTCLAISMSPGTIELPTTTDLRSDGEGEEDDDPGTSRGDPAIGQ